MKKLKTEEVHGVLLSILKEIHSFCEQNNITYYLAYGTLLGAVRHKGFIPWDDDIDICIPRPDYERFLRTFSKNSPNIQVISYHTNNKYPHYYAKVQNTDTILITDLPFKYKIGINIDVFPIDAVPDKKRLQEKYNRSFNFYRNIYNIKAIRYRSERSFFKKILFVFSRIIISVVPTTFLVKKLDRISQQYNYDDHNLVSIAASVDKRLFLEKEMFGEGVKLNFEGIEVNVPYHYHEILKKNYGDYMKLPSENKRLTHNTIAYLK
ncbi:lipopolysaccharide cholinephosphotransferase [Porphyromonadaceae bacterium NLAE-zl-C104]|nr:lipopolysaccharide cholinephosphotransferase [Porphyromonadaceae bacterium NLAE-zl-C104]